MCTQKKKRILHNITATHVPVHMKQNTASLEQNAESIKELFLKRTDVTGFLFWLQCKTLEVIYIYIYNVCVCVCVCVCVEPVAQSL